VSRFTVYSLLAVVFRGKNNNYKLLDFKNMIERFLV